MTVRSRTTLALLGGVALGVAATMTGTVLAERDNAAAPVAVAHPARAPVPV